MDGRKRIYKAIVPDEYKSEKLPLVIVLHGGGGNNLQIEKHSGFTEVAEREKFAVCYPQGFSKQWNDGRDILQSRAHRLKINDVEFISMLIDKLIAGYNIDERRVFVCGISNGGMMSYRLACELPDKITAIAAVAANISDFLVKNCSGRKNISAMVINGSEDRIMPYNGGMVSVGRKKRGRVTSTEYTIRLLNQMAGINNIPSGMEKYDNVKDDGTSVQKILFSGHGNTNILMEVTGGGHTWPGSIPVLPEKIVGRTSKEFKAQEEIWDFFRAK